MYPDVEFTLFLPPYSKFRLITRYKRRSAFLYQTLRKTQRFDNVRLYSFDDCAFNSNLFHYKDTGHYRETINSFIVDQMANKQNLLSLDNIYQYHARMLHGLAYRELKSENTAPSCIEN